MSGASKLNFPLSGTLTREARIKREARETEEAYENEALRHGGAKAELEREAHVKREGRKLEELADIRHENESPPATPEPTVVSDPNYLADLRSQHCPTHVHAACSWRERNKHRHELFKKGDRTSP